MASNILHNLEEKTAGIERHVIPLLLLLVVVVGSIRLIPWINDKTSQFIGSDAPPNSQLIDNAQSDTSVQINTELAPIITQTNIPLGVTRSQQLTQLLSNIKDTPKIAVATSNEDPILVEEIKVADRRRPVSTPAFKPETFDSSESVSSNIASDQNSEHVSNTLQISKQLPIDNPTLKTSVSSNNEDILSQSNLPSTKAKKDINQFIPVADPPSISTKLNTFNADVEKNQKTDLNPKETIRETIVDWAKAWSSQNTSGYLNHYVNDYSTERYSSSSAWRKWRKARIEEPNNIAIKLEDIDVQLDVDDDSAAIATFIQKYRTTSYADDTIKSLEFVRKGNEWLINKEVALQTFKRNS